MENSKDQRAISRSILVEDDVSLAPRRAQVRPVFKNCLCAHRPIADVFKVRIEQAHVSDRLLSIPFFDGVKNDPSDIAVG